MRKQNVLSGVYGYILEAGHLTPVSVPATRDESGTLVAYFSTLANDRKGTTIAGATLSDVALDAPVFFTFNAVRRAAQKAQTPVILGRPVDVNPRSWFGRELARLTGRNAHELILAGWREEQHDADKAGYTLAELDAAVTDAYTQ